MVIIIMIITINHRGEWLPLLYNFIQQSLKTGSAHIQILLARGM